MSREEDRLGVETAKLLARADGEDVCGDEWPEAVEPAALRAGLGR